MINFLRNKQKEMHLGFTLIELLVVIAIIGVLASIVLASLNNARAKSRDANRITGQKQLMLALELFFDGAGNGSYPQPQAAGPPGTLPTSLQTNGYIPQIPTPPTGTTGTCSAAYCYAVNINPGATTYHIGVRLEQNANTGVLATDKDCDSSAANPSTAGCTTGTATYVGGFSGGSGATDVIYDVQP